MVLKAPNMSKCTQKCKCGFGKNEGVVYDQTDPCEGLGGGSQPSLFNPLTCDCDPVAAAGDIQWRATSASSNLHFDIFGGEGDDTDQQLNTWFSMVTAPIYNQTNANGNLYLHSPRIRNITLGYFTGTCDTSFAGGEPCPDDCTPWPKFFSVTKNEECNSFYTGDCPSTSMMLPTMLRYDPDTGEQVTFSSSGDCGSGTLAIGWHFSSDCTPICRNLNLPPGHPDRNKEEPVGTIWSANIEWRYPKQDLLNSGNFDPLNASHWEYP